MDYRPIGGSLGHLVAGPFSRDPKSEIDDDLMRLKTYIEKAKVPHDAVSKRRNDMKIEEIMTKKSEVLHGYDELARSRADDAGK
jgi:hypothetical protein